MTPNADLEETIDIMRDERAELLTTLEWALEVLDSVHSLLVEKEMDRLNRALALLHRVKETTA